MSRIQEINWEKSVDPKLKDDKEVTPKFPDDPRKEGPATSGNQNKPDLRHWYAGNWRTSVGKGSGGPV